MATVIVGALLAVLFALAVRRIHREKLLGKCGGDCSACAAGCAEKEE